MLCETHGLGTERYDAVSGQGEPVAIVHVRTRLIESEQVWSYINELMPALQALWTKPGVIRMQVWGDQTTEGLHMIVVGLDHTIRVAFATRALAVYQPILAKHRTPDAQPPMSHDVCFLPSGYTVQYSGHV